MKLRTKIAGTLALPLALAVAANVNAAQITDELKIGGFIAATADWTIQDDANKGTNDSNVDFGLGLGTSRIGITYVKNGVTYMYENDWNGNAASGNLDIGDEYRLRHAAIKYDGWVAGYTWSGFANRTALAETIDATGPTKYSAYAQRTATLGKSFNVANGIKLGLFAEHKKHPLDSETKGKSRTASTAIPDLVANFEGDFGVAQTFAAVRMMQVDKAPTGGKAKTEGAVDFTLGVNSQLTDEFNLKFAATMFDKKSLLNSSGDGADIGLQLGAQYKINDQIRTNLVVEHVIRDEDETDTTGIWLNGFYKLNNGWEWGAELRYATTDDQAKANDYDVAGLNDKDMKFSLLAKYAF